MGAGSLGAIVFFVVMVGVLVGTTFLWVIAGASFLALVCLIIFMAQQKKFIGPRVLADDIRDRFDAMGRDETDEDDTVLIVEKD